MTAEQPKGAGGCDAQAHELLSVAEAKQRIMNLASPLSGCERLGIRAALGRVLAEDIVSPINVPPHDNSAMDGYAIMASDLPSDGERTLEVVGSAFAGTPSTTTLQSGQCIRIMTGAVLPLNADTIIAQELVRTSGTQIVVAAGHRCGQDVRRAGEDVRADDVVLGAGTQIAPAELGLLASLGVAEVTVFRRLRVAFFSTGDELRGTAETLGPGEIHDSNRYSIHGMLARLDIESLDLGVIRDRRDDVRKAIREASALADVVISSGGVSVGEADYIKETLEELGEIQFWRMAMKPGKPLAVGRIEHTLFFGLPGNPVSVMATFYQFVQPALRHMQGHRHETSLLLRVPTVTALHKEPGRLEYQRGILEHDDDGRLVVRTTGLQDSHVLTSMSRANCFIILPAESSGASAGETVEIQPFRGLI